MEKWETCLWFSTFPSGPKPGGGNVGNSRGVRVVQGPVEREGNLLLVFRTFHGPGISTAYCWHVPNSMIAESGQVSSELCGSLCRQAFGGLHSFIGLSLHPRQFARPFAVARCRFFVLGLGAFQLLFR